MTAANSGNKTLSFYNNSSPEEKVEILFRRYYSGLCKSLYRLLHDTSLAEDIVQEVFLKVWEMRETIQMDEAIQSYLYRSCYNTALNFLKRQKSQTDIEAILTLASDSGAEKHLNIVETENQILAAIAVLPPKTKLVFTLSRFEELSYKEIAERLDISVKSVEKHMGIALQRLRENLKEFLTGLLLFLLTQ